MKIHKIVEAQTMPQSTVQYLNQFLRAMDTNFVQYAQGDLDLENYLSKLNPWKDGMISLVGSIQSDPSITPELKAIITTIQATMRNAIGSKRAISRDELTQLRNLVDALR